MHMQPYLCQRSEHVWKSPNQWKDSLGCSYNAFETLSTGVRCGTADASNLRQPLAVPFPILAWSHATRRMEGGRAHLQAEPNLIDGHHQLRNYAEYWP